MHSETCHQMVVRGQFHVPSGKASPPPPYPPKRPDGHCSSLGALPLTRIEPSVLWFIMLPREQTKNRTHLIRNKPRINVLYYVARLPPAL